MALSNAASLAEICARLRGAGVRSSIFVAADPEQIRAAAAVGPTAWNCTPSRMPTVMRATVDWQWSLSSRPPRPPARRGTGLNAYHDLNLREPALLRPEHPLARRGEHRPRHNLRRALSRHRAHHTGIPGLSEAIAITLYSLLFTFYFIKMNSLTFTVARRRRRLPYDSDGVAPHNEHLHLRGTLHRHKPRFP